MHANKLLNGWNGRPISLNLTHLVNIMISKVKSPMKPLSSGQSLYNIGGEQPSCALIPCLISHAGEVSKKQGMAGYGRPAVYIKTLPCPSFGKWGEKRRVMRTVILIRVS